MNSLGSLYWDQGKLDKAEELYLRALAGREKALGSDHIETLTTVHNLGTLYWNQDKLKKGELMIVRALIGFTKALGTDHASTINAARNLRTYRHLREGWIGEGYSKADADSVR